MVKDAELVALDPGGGSNRGRQRALPQLGALALRCSLGAGGRDAEETPGGLGVISCSAARSTHPPDAQTVNGADDLVCLHHVFPSITLSAQLATATYSGVHAGPAMTVGCPHPVARLAAVDDDRPAAWSGAQHHAISGCAAPMQRARLGVGSASARFPPTQATARRHAERCEVGRPDGLVLASPASLPPPRIPGEGSANELRRTSCERGR